MFGNEEQKQKYLTPCAKGEKVIAFALTEPGAGSDAGGVTTTAELDGDEYVLNGRKTFISGAPFADYSIVYAKTGEEHELMVDGVFIAVGAIANNEICTGKIALDQSGYVLSGEDCRTSEPGIFVAGDLRSKNLRQGITACSDGANAIYSIERFLLG